ncbi:MAG: serine hydrolase domain-containing protein [Bacteroidota bacterium]
MKKSFVKLLSSGIFLILLSACNQAGNAPKPEDYGLSSDTLVAAGQDMQAYIDKGTYAGIATMILADGKVIDRHNYGYADMIAQKPIADNNIYRIYSMTKPLVTAGLMILYDEGKFQLDDPVSKYIPAFANTQVYTPEGLVPQEHPMTIVNLLTHTSGLTYGWDQHSYVDSLYRLQRDMDWYSQPLESAINNLATLPLKYQPGTKYEYSLSIDVAGYLIEVLSGMPLDEFLSERLFLPLKMEDTGFYVPADKKDRLVTVYYTQEDGSIKGPDDPSTDRFFEKPMLFSGGGGLVSTMDDYARFSTMLLNKGELDGTRVLQESTVDLILTNHLPEGVELWEGYGYGLGGSLNLATGDYGWGGAASTSFRIYPANHIAILAFAQLMPANFAFAEEYTKKVVSTLK